MRVRRKAAKMIITRYGPKRSRPVRGRNSRRTRKASPRFKAWYDRQARMDDYIDRRDAYDPQIHESRFVREYNERFDAGECLADETAALGDQAKLEAEVVAWREKQDRLNQLHDLEDAIRLKALSDLERRVIELRYCHGEPDGARVLKVFTIRGDTILKPGTYLSAEEVEGIAPENLRALQEAGYLQVFRRTAPAWTPPRPRDQVKRGRPSTSGWTGPLPYETIAEALGLANASVAFKAEARAIAKLHV